MAPPITWVALSKQAAGTGMKHPLLRPSHPGSALWSDTSLPLLPQPLHDVARANEYIASHTFLDQKCL